MGDVMKESTSIAYTFAKSLMALGYPGNKFFEKAAIHLHVPEGATPKDGTEVFVLILYLRIKTIHYQAFLKLIMSSIDLHTGPSAGITMATSLLSLALQKPLEPTIAMTGELTLTGKVLKIGGLREKAVAAKRSGVTTLIYPEANLSDWEELPENVKEGLKGVPVAWYSDVFKVVFGDISKEYATNVWDSMFNQVELEVAVSKTRKEEKEFVER